MGLNGVILGDAAGMPFEFGNALGIDDWQKEPYDLYFGEHTMRCHVTDDTVLSFACAKAIVSGKFDFAKQYYVFGNRYENAGYGQRFNVWLTDAKKEPYDSFGNGAAMRCSFCGLSAKSAEDAAILAYFSAIPTHSHPEGIKGAVTLAVCVWMAENGYSKADILNYGISQYPKDKYSMSAEYSLPELEEKANYFDVTCQGSVPLAVRLFYEFDRFDQMMFWINARHIDCDTIGAISGAIFDSFYHECFLTDRDIIKYLLTSINEWNQHAEWGDTLLKEYLSFDKIPDKKIKRFCDKHRNVVCKELKTLGILY